MRVPDPVIQAALQNGNLIYLEVAHKKQISPSSEILHALSEILSKNDATKAPIRICIPSLGSPRWGSLTSQVIGNQVHTYFQ